MRILVQFPTFHRKEKFLNCLKKYDSTIGVNSVHFNINCDHDDESMNNDDTRNEIKNVVKNGTYTINYIKNSNKISAINDNITVDFDVVICASDDMIPVVEKWDEYISDNMQLYFPDLSGALHFNDKYAGSDLITLSIMGKKLYDYFGYIYHPDYKSLYCDNEFTEEVYRLNKVKYIDKTIIAHEHYTREGNVNSGDYDIAAQKTIYYANRDALVFQRRKELGFPKDKITND